MKKVYATDTGFPLHPFVFIIAWILIPPSSNSKFCFAFVTTIKSSTVTSSIQVKQTFTSPPVLLRQYHDHLQSNRALMARKKNSNLSNEDNDDDHNGDNSESWESPQKQDKQLEADIAYKLTKQKAIMALSKRNYSTSSLPSSNPNETLSSIRGRVNPQGFAGEGTTKSKQLNKNNSKRNTLQRSKKRDFMKHSISRTSALPSEPKSFNFTQTTLERSGPPSEGTVGNNTNKNNDPAPQIRPTSKVSLLPPPLSNLSDDDLTSGLSSWEEFLGQTLPSQQQKKQQQQQSNAVSGIGTQLPNIRDLFPPLTNQKSRNTSTRSNSISSFSSSKSSLGGEDFSSTEKRIQGMDGVMPVSELFYRSSQSLSQESTTSSMIDDERNSGNNNYNDENPADDEELPFSAEQSDSLISEDGKVHIRQNEAQQFPKEKLSSSSSQQSRRSSSRKMVRRGMEMLVGGVPINVDPPQRSVELSYQLPYMSNSIMNPQQQDNATTTPSYDWAQVISLNTRDFGPLLHQPSIAQVSLVERGLYCESFVHNAIKWDVCPDFLREIVKQHSVDQASTSSSSSSYASLLQDSKDIWNQRSSTNAFTTTRSSTFGKRPLTTLGNSLFVDNTIIAGEDDNDDDNDRALQEFLEHPDMPFEYQFEIQGISKEELESVTDPVMLQYTIMRAIVLVVQDKLLVDDIPIAIHQLTVGSSTKGDEVSTRITIEFHFEAQGQEEDVMPVAQSIQPLLTQALQDGTFSEAMVEAATEEGWFQEIITEMRQDWAFVSCMTGSESRFTTKPQLHVRLDEGKANWGATDKSNGLFDANLANQDTFGDDESDNLSDLFLGGGNDGVFFDYSEANRANAPFQGNLGPLLFDAATERAKQRYPRVIAIGDVHGCIDELQDLLRLCDYQPGDLVCFLGDLVCKGPDSISVVQMAREIGAIGIRGNHDFEVVRWYQAIQSGVDPPVVGSEHFHIASCLSKADMKWLYSLPWFISSKDLGALFVHAGFVAGIRLAKQNPRLMMNMRSILPDGTVTSKFFSNWPWARLWDGPQTVLFGHDADRGLQQYEHAIGLDTGCVYGGRLTACILPEKRLVSVNARREYFKYRRRHYD